MDINTLRRLEFLRRDDHLRDAVPMVLDKNGSPKETLHIVYVMTWVGVCGGSKIILEQCNRLAALGHQVTVLCHFSRPDWYPLDGRVSFLSPPFGEVLRVPPCDVVVVTYWKEIYECVEQRVAPVVYFEQGDSHLFDPDSMDPHMMDHVRKQIQIAPFVLTVSTYAAEMLNKRFGVAAHVVPNAVNKAVFYPGGEKPRHGKTVITAIGPDYIGFKRLPNILAAIQALKDEGEEIVFQWITPGAPDPSRTEPAIVNPPQEVIGDALRRTDIFVCASIYESFCLPVLEAMTCGAAVVTTDCGGIRDYVSNGVNALVVPKDDIGALTGALRRLIKEPELRQSLAACGLEVAKNFDWDLTAKKLEEYFTDIACHSICKPKLVHTLLLFLREGHPDWELAESCLKTLERSSYTTVVVCNNGYLRNDELTERLKPFKLRCIVAGSGENAGIIVGRQLCFDMVGRLFPEADYVTELHPDMKFSSNWEDPLVAYLESNPDEPVSSCGIVSDLSACVNPDDPDELDAYLTSLRRDSIERGYTLPCVHRIGVLRAVGGFDARFLTGKQAFEDDSLLLGYHYYYGTRANWHPKVNCNSVVYHAVGGQRFGLNADLYENFNGLLRQYGAMGIGVLSRLHVAPWQVGFFTDKFSSLASASGG
ncbi:MAG: glycosyltransferase [Oscillospiraceae bacterium]|jgi:glycosyltransferase involved in cell wall biosynthesis|nr:glycosyltransferase [Oscillospiraceae bacterium]